MPLIAPGIVRYAVNQTYGGREVVNILDMQVDTTGTVEERADAIFDVAGDIINNWYDHVLKNQVAQISLQSVSWVDLDSEEGSTGERTSTDTRTLPSPGRGLGTGLPGNVSVLVTKVAPGGGRRTRNGRLYLAGITEDVTTGAAPNQMAPVFVTGFNTDFEDFLEGINDEEGLGNIQRQLVVVRTHAVGTPPNETIVYDGFSSVTGLPVQAQLATQRRRLRG